MTSSLGKRTRAAFEGTKDAISKGVSSLTGGVSDRRASLRRRSVGAKQEEEASEPPRKKQNTALSTLFSSSEDKEKEVVEKKKAPLPKKKRWLSHGLYAGQRDDCDKVRPRGKDKGRPSETGRKHILPLPMFGFLDQDRDFNLPFDVYNALPKGQPKPDEWKKTRSNQFVGDSKEVWRHMSSNMPDSKCVCVTETGCDEDCLNRYMYYECDDKNCAVGKDRCSNRQFADLKERVKTGKKYDIGVEVQKYSNKGFGVRACRSFEPHQIIVEYSGEIITQEECEDRMHNQYKNKSDYYLMTFDQNMIIDATRGSIARFVNHSCSPNCAMVKWTVQNKPRMALFAGERGIMTGEELTYDYNFDPFSMKNVQVCHCGSEDCRGFLGPRPSKTQEKALNLAIATVNGVKRKVSELMGSKKSSAPPSPAKSSPGKRSPVKRGYIRGPYKKRRIDVPIRSAGRKVLVKGARHAQRVVPSAKGRRSVDKENKTPSSKTGTLSSSSAPATPSSEPSFEKNAGTLKRGGTEITMQSTLPNWFKPIDKPVKRNAFQVDISTTSKLAKGFLGTTSGKKVQKRGGAQPTASPNKGSKSRPSPAIKTSNKTDTPNKTKVCEPDEAGWVSNGVKGKGKWRWEAVPV